MRDFEVRLSTETSKRITLLDEYLAILKEADIKPSVFPFILFIEMRNQI